MQQILFKGKSSENNQWVEGFYFWSEKENKHYIVGESVDYGFQKIEVDPKTRCQYTNLIDVNGVKIFENDIIQRDFKKGCYVSGVVEGHVQYNLDEAKFELDTFLLSIFDKQVVVIGNKYDVTNLEN